MDPSKPMAMAEPGNGGRGAEPAAAQLHILVIDDDRDVCLFLEDFLSNEGYRVRSLHDPTQALDLLREDDYHVVILDLMMPKLSGMDLLEQIRRVDDDIAVIIFTGQPTIDTAQASIRHDVSAYLKKPLDTDEFRDALTRIAKRKGLVLRREDELHQTIGKNIRDWRKNRALTLKQMSRRTGLSVSLLSQIERAESSASVSSLFKISTALNVKLTELLGDF